MPFIIIQRHYVMPAVAETATEGEMMAWLAGRPYVPREARASSAAAAAWLSTLPRPSGWYDSVASARAALRARPHPPRRAATFVSDDAGARATALATDRAHDDGVEEGGGDSSTGPAVASSPAEGAGFTDDGDPQAGAHAEGECRASGRSRSDDTNRPAPAGTDRPALPTELPGATARPALDMAQ